MREWIVEGVDHKGELRKVRVRAQDEGGATASAQQRGLNPPLSAYVERSMDYETPAAVAVPPPAAPKDRTAEAAKAGKRLRAADGVLSFIGWGYIAIAVAVLVLGIVVGMRDIDGDGRAFLIQALIVGVAFGSAGLLFMGAGAALRMLAIMGECAAERR